MKRRHFLAGLSIGFVGLSSSDIQLPLDNFLYTKRSCPSFIEGIEDTICQPGNDRIQIEVQTSQKTTSSATVALTNTSDIPCSLNPAGWKLYRFEDGDWTNLSPDYIWQGATVLDTEGSYKYIFNRAKSTDDSNRYTTIINTIPLTEGRYAFATRVRWGDGNASKTVEVVSTFDI